MDETYRIYLGASITTFDTKATFDSRSEEVGGEIDFEDDLGFDNDVRSGWLQGFWRFAENHRLRFRYSSIRRSAGTVSQRDLEVGDYIINSGASIQSSFKVDIFDIEYVYSLYNRPHLEIGASAGLYWYKNQAELSASGDVVIEGGDQVEFNPSFRTMQTVHAPLPLLGITASYEVTPRWRVHGGVRLMGASIDNISGRIVSTSVATDYYFTDHLGFGISVVDFDLEVDRTGVVFRNSLSWSYQGALMYVVTKF